MNRTLYQLAYRNIQKYKKHYLFMTIFIFLISIFFMSYIIIWDNHYELKKIQNEEQYGKWYVVCQIIDYNFEKGYQEALDSYFESFERPIQYGYIDHYGFYDENYMIARMDENLFDLTKTTFIEGKKATKSNEINISQNLKNDKSLSLHQKISLMISGQLKEYEIVGIVNKSNDIFPDIYTPISLGYHTYIVSDSSLYYNMGTNMGEAVDGTIGKANWEISLSIAYMNEFGYDHGAGEIIELGKNQIIIFIEVLGLSSFALFLLTSTSLKRRTKEFALLRGIGMTNQQLCLMVLYEMTYTSIIAVILGIIASFGLSYGVMIYFQMIYGHFVYQIKILKVLFYGGILMGCVLISYIYPIYSSAQSALSGTFDSQKFQYIQVRYKKLKKQSKSYLALRELKAYKKVTLCIYCIISVLVVYYTSAFCIPQEKEFSLFHYIQIYDSDFSNESLKSLKIKYASQIKTYRLYSGKAPIQFINVEEGYWTDDVFLINDLQVLDYCQIKGHIPQNNHEVLICHQDFEMKGKYNANITSGYQFQIGDTFIMNDQEYYVVGQIMPNEEITRYDSQYNLYYLPECSFYVLPQTFQTIKDQTELESNLTSEDFIYDTSRYYYQTPQEKEQFIKDVEKINDEIYMYDSDSNLSQSFESDINIDMRYLLIPTIVCLIFCYFVNKNHMLNSQKDFGLYQLIGMTKKDLVIKQIWKVVWMTIFVLIMQIFWVISFQLYLRALILPIKEIIITILIVFLTCLIIYCLPIFSFIKKDAMSLIDYNE